MPSCLPCARHVVPRTRAHRGHAGPPQLTVGAARHAQNIVELIELTRSLLAGSEGVAHEPPGPAAAAADGAGDEPAAAPQRIGLFVVGDECEAVWKQDGLYYEAQIEGFSVDGTTALAAYRALGERDWVSVKTLRRKGERVAGNAAGTLLAALQPRQSHGAAATSAALAAVAAGRSAAIDEADEEAGGERARKRHLAAGQLEKIQRNRKKQERLAAKDQIQQEAANKWKRFIAKPVTGKVKQSIFATSENPNGRVGIGTCGIGGKPPTAYNEKREAWRQVLPKH